MSDGIICDECKKLIDQETEEVVNKIEDGTDNVHVRFQVYRPEGKIGDIFPHNADLHQDCIEGLLEGFVEAKLGTQMPDIVFDEKDKEILGRVVENMRRYDVSGTEGYNAADKLAAILDGAVVAASEEKPLPRAAFEKHIEIMKGWVERDWTTGLRGHFRTEIILLEKALVEAPEQDTRPLPRAAIEAHIASMKEWASTVHPPSYSPSKAYFLAQIELLEEALAEAPVPPIEVVNQDLLKLVKESYKALFEGGYTSSIDIQFEAAIKAAEEVDDSVPAPEHIHADVIRKAQAGLKDIRKWISGQGFEGMQHELKGIANDLDAAIQGPCEMPEDILFELKQLIRHTVKQSDYDIDALDAFVVAAEAASAE